MAPNDARWHRHSGGPVVLRCALEVRNISFYFGAVEHYIRETDGISQVYVGFAAE